MEDGQTDPRHSLWGGATQHTHTRAVGVQSGDIAVGKALVGVEILGNSEFDIRRYHEFFDREMSQLDYPCPYVSQLHIFHLTLWALSICLTRAELLGEKRSTGRWPSRMKS